MSSSDDDDAMFGMPPAAAAAAAELDRIEDLVINNNSASDDPGGRSKRQRHGSATSDPVPDDDLSRLQLNDDDFQLKPGEIRIPTGLFTSKRGTDVTKEPKRLNVGGGGGDGRRASKLEGLPPLEGMDAATYCAKHMAPSATKAAFDIVESRFNLLPPRRQIEPSLHAEIAALQKQRSDVIKQTDLTRAQFEVEQRGTETLKAELAALAAERDRAQSRHDAHVAMLKEAIKKGTRTARQRVSPVKGRDGFPGRKWKDQTSDSATLSILHETLPKRKANAALLAGKVAVKEAENERLEGKIMAARETALEEQRRYDLEIAKLTGDMQKLAIGAQANADKHLVAAASAAEAAASPAPAVDDSGGGGDGDYDKITCDGCSLEQVGECYTCTKCDSGDSFELCHACFNNGDKFDVEGHTHAKADFKVFKPRSNPDTASTRPPRRTASLFAMADLERQRPARKEEEDELAESKKMRKRKKQTRQRLQQFPAAPKGPVEPPKPDDNVIAEMAARLKRLQAFKPGVPTASPTIDSSRRNLERALRNRTLLSANEVDFAAIARQFDALHKGGTTIALFNANEDLPEDYAETLNKGFEVLDVYDSGTIETMKRVVRTQVALNAMTAVSKQTPNGHQTRSLVKKMMAEKHGEKPSPSQPKLLAAWMKRKKSLKI